MPNIKWLLKYPIILTNLVHKVANGSSILGTISDTNKNKTEIKASNGKNKSKAKNKIKNINANKAENINPNERLPRLLGESALFVAPAIS